MQRTASRSRWTTSRRQASACSRTTTHRTETCPNASSDQYSSSISTAIRYCVPISSKKMTFHSCFVLCTRSDQRRYSGSDPMARVCDSRQFYRSRVWRSSYVSCLCLPSRNSGTACCSWQPSPSASGRIALVSLSLKNPVLQVSILSCDSICCIRIDFAGQRCLASASPL